MLPDFRVLFAIVLLSVSLLVFGLGATALLRAAHDNFAGLAAPPPASEAQVAREREQRQATLALLRVEPQAEPAQRPELSPPLEASTAADTPASAPAAAEPVLTEAGPAEPAIELKAEVSAEAAPAQKVAGRTDAATEVASQATARAPEAPVVVALAPAVSDVVTPAAPTAPAAMPAPIADEAKASADDAILDATAPAPPSSGENAEPSSAKLVAAPALDPPALTDLPENVIKAAARPRPEIPRLVAKRHKKPKIVHVRTAARARPAAQPISPSQQQRRPQQPTLFSGFGG